MEGNYEVKFGGQNVGQVQVRREGLYWRFSCRCRIRGDAVCRLVVSCGGKEESLGIPVPSGEEFRLDTKLATKHLMSGKMDFFLAPNRPVLRGKFVPISPEEPFAYLSRLKDAYLARQDGVLGVVICEKR